MTEPNGRPATAQHLGAYRRELLEQGFTDDQADSLVRQAAEYLVRDYGLRVSEVPANA